MNQLDSLIYIINEDNESEAYYELWEKLENNFCANIMLKESEVEHLLKSLSKITSFSDGMYLLCDWIYKSGNDYSFVFDLSKEYVGHSAWTDLFQDAYFAKHYFMNSKRLPSISPNKNFDRFADELKFDKDISIIEFEYLINVFVFEHNTQKNKNSISVFCKKILSFNNYQNYKEQLLSNPNSNYGDYFSMIENGVQQSHSV